jgi:RNA polymerase sigma factor (sigma-70 family)
MPTDSQLLGRFLRDRAEDAFAELVARHLGLVHSAALRMVGGDAHLARDVAQTVFADLARKAPALAGREVLAGWLYTSTHHAAANIVRAERRRREREQEAHAMSELDGNAPGAADWERVRPVLDAAMGELDRRDRDAILLRYFEGSAFADIAARLGVTESGARMRVERALAKLHAQLGRRGIRSTTAALAAALTSSAVAAPPAGLAATVTTTALSAAAVATTATATTAAVLNYIGMTKTQLTIAASVLTMGTVGAGFQINEQNRLHADIDALRGAPVRQEAASSGATNAGGASAPSAIIDPALAARDVETLRAEEAALNERLRELRMRSAKTVSASTSSGGAAATGTAGSFTMKDLDAAPQPLDLTQPLYPFELKRAGIPGEALLSFVIDKEGKAADVTVVDATHPDFAIAAIEAVEQWRFEPGRKGGRQVNTRVQQVLRFAQADNNWF